MKPVIIINRLSIKPGKMGEFIDAQQQFAAATIKTPNGLIGGRMYRGGDDTSAVPVAVRKPRRDRLIVDSPEVGA